MIELWVLRSNGHRSQAKMEIGYADAAALKKAGRLALELLDVMTNG